MPEKELRAVVLSRGDRDALVELVTQLRKESRHVESKRILRVIDAFDVSEQLPSDWSMPEPTIMRSGKEWAALEGIQLRDPDGWRGDSSLGAKALDEPMDREEFDVRRQESTVGPS